MPKARSVPFFNYSALFVERESEIIAVIRDVMRRGAFILQQEGFSLTDISAITGENSETIKSRLRYARKFFKQHLEDQ